MKATPENLYKIVAAEQTIPLSQVNSARFPEMLLGYQLAEVERKLQEALQQGDLIANPNDIMVTVRVETIAIPKETS